MARGDMQRPLAPRRWLGQHARDLVDSLGRLYRRPAASLLTTAVIGITLALPAGLHVLLKNLDALSYSWQDTIQASLFLAEDTDEATGRELAERLSARSAVAGTDYISRADALAEFKRLSGFSEAIEALDGNPLPAVITVRPAADLPAGEVEALIAELDALPEVADARLDQAWLERLYALLEVVRRGVFIVALLLAFAVVFIVGNTIRLDIENRREQIEVMKLLGAPDAFVRRPFLYSGVWYGLIGGVVAWLLLTVCLLALAGPVRRLAGLYGGQGGLAWLGAGESLLLIVAGIGLGWLGSAWTVGRHLRAIEPR